MSVRRCLIARDLLTMAGPPASELRGNIGDAAREEALVGLLHDGAVCVEAGRVVWVGPAVTCPDGFGQPELFEVLMPAWVECHTHALFAGSRAPDFARRNAGLGYAEILEAGGGISSTVRQTREASDEALLASLIARLERFAAQGVGAVEVKTGYGLDYDEELRHLRIIREAARTLPQLRIVATCLAAHVVPPEYRERRADYVTMVCDRLLPEVARLGLAEQVDVFCDRGAFTVEESRAILTRAKALGFALRAHSEELAHTGGTLLAAELGARSADHLEHARQEDFAAMAAAGTAAVLLPLVTIHLDLPDRPKARALIAAGVEVALSTDYNPGSANSDDLALTVSLGCSLLKLTPAEALRGVTRVAAEVLGLADHGRIEVGAAAKFVAFDLPCWSDLPWHMGAAPGRLPLLG